MEANAMEMKNAMMSHLRSEGEWSVTSPGELLDWALMKTITI